MTKRELDEIEAAIEASAEPHLNDPSETLGLIDEIRKLQSQVKTLESALGTAALPLEALYLTEMDSRWMCQDLKNGVVVAVGEIRKVLGVWTGTW